MGSKRNRPYTRLRIMAEYGSSGIWAAEPVGPFRHGMLSHGELGLTVQLAARFDTWIDRYWQRLDDEFDAILFNAEGLELALELKRHVGPATEVVFAPESEDGGLEPDRVVEAL